MSRQNMSLSMQTTIISACLGLSVIVLNSGCNAFGPKVKSEALTAYENGMNLYEKKLYSDAVKQFEKVINEFPDNPITQVCYYYLGDSLREIGDVQKAIKTFEALADKYKDGYWANSARKQLRTLKAGQ